MKTIHILNSPHWSGASHYCITLCRKLLEQGHEVLLLTEPGKPLEKARSFGIPLDDTIRLNHRNPYLYLHAIKRMSTIFKTFKPDVISSHINEGAWMAGFIARKVVPQAAVVRIRTDIAPPKAHFINRYVHHAWTDHIIVGSQLHKRLSHKILDFPESKIDVVYGPIDTDRFAPSEKGIEDLRNEFHIPPSTLAIGITARLDPVKGHEYALEAMRILISAHVPAVLVCIGYESNRTLEWLMREAEERGIKDYIRPVIQYKEDVVPLLRMCDIGLITSVGSEANCRAALEYMAVGKPVTASMVGVIPEVVQDGEHGFLVPPRDPPAIAEALRKLAANPVLRIRMGKAAREHVLANFNLNLFVKRTESAYEKAIRDRSGMNDKH